MTSATLPQPVARSELEPILRRLLARHFGEARRIQVWHRRLSPYSSSSPVTRIRVKLIGRREPWLVALKDLTPGCQLPTAQRVRPAFLYDPNRETATYAHVLNRLELGTARSLEVELSNSPPRRWLFLEWVHGPLLWQMGAFRHWQRSAEWLARFHHEARRLPGLGRSLKRVQPLAYDRGTYALWLSRAESVLRDSLLRKDRVNARRFARLARHYGQVVECLCRLPNTLVHGEFYPANVLMRWTGRDHQPCPIDWELTGWAPGVLDLAALSAGAWDPSAKQKLLRAYDAVSRDYPGERVDAGELSHGLLCAHLHLCLRQLGWAVRWRPQGQSARTWLTQALTLADELQL